MALTVEEKARAFDMICHMLRGRGEYLRTKRVPIPDTSGTRNPGSTFTPNQQYKHVDEFRFVLIAHSSDFMKSMEDLLKGNPL